MFVVVKVHEKRQDKTFYEVAVVTKSGVEPYGPYIPQPAIFENDQNFREFLLAKCNLVVESITHFESN